MSQLDVIRTLGAKPEQLEQTYRQAVGAGEADAFAETIEMLHAEQPDNVLYAAWHYRLAYAATQMKERVIAWGWAAPLALLNGLVLWLLSDNALDIQVGGMTIPAILLTAATVSAMAVLLFLVVAGPRRWRRALTLIVALAALTTYVFLIHSRLIPRVFEDQYLTLAAIHLALLAWAAVGAYLLWSRRDAENRFAFLIKSLEVFIMAGLFAIAWMIFTGISFGLFDAIGIQPQQWVQRLFIAGGGGLIPVLAVAIIYDPQAEPVQQRFDEGLSKLIATLMRVLLPLTLLVLLIYLAFIPFNFRQPFENRDVLIIYNGMLFAVMVLLVGATPAPGSAPTARVSIWLRRGIIATAALALFVGLYAFAAIVYRTMQDGLTPNRLTFIGWNIINLSLLGLLLIKQVRAGGERWLSSVRATFAMGMIPYAAWALFVVVTLPWLFGSAPKGVERLPDEVQTIVYEYPAPILLKCADSPHIYLLDDGEKRWVKDIPTFEAQGYTWLDVQFVSCAALRTITDGLPIPADAGEPPQP